MNATHRSAIVLGTLLAMVTGIAGATNVYREQSYSALTADKKARRKGDVITVQVFENASATSAANTSAGRDAQANIGVDGPVHSRRAALSAGTQHEGGGATRREGRVLAQLTVTVRGITENGDLLIAGEQYLEVNNERQQIRVEGRVRAQDVSETNTVLSTRIADARISYAGSGDLADRQRPSWWQMALTWFGL